MDAKSGPEGHESKEGQRLSKSYDYEGVWLDRGRRPEAAGRNSETSVDPRGALIVEWERLGLDANGLYCHLHQAGVARIEYERRRQRIADGRNAGGLETKRKIRVLNHAEPLMLLLSSQKDGDQDAGQRDILEALKSLVARRRSEIHSAQLEKLPRNRPGEPWLADYVLLLAEHLRGAGQSWRKTLRLIYAAFTVVGMADVVTKDAVRSILRRAKARVPDFRGKLLPTKCKWCSSGPSGIGQAIEDLKYMRARDPEAYRRLGRDVRAGSLRILQEAKRKLGAVSRRHKRALLEPIARRARVDREFVIRQADDLL